ncbi:hypothetical protein BN970_01392 [Mycolicibacterium conceptionense]|uniref:Uncharacterized protein n=1 Tax=Mycolicibacterium conceptionense TaxID=451644 RepID=A0A0U1D3K3_9MYCO|nr:hypothetical protein [Mycolicibacterium conceptionense]ORV20980.1 hypothetical protein AWB98_01400 [Mycolicibacterium conceptionense]CQD07379.1 hypothetical protein BN970_01392 [Mycolicibacterium conceptionense]
MAHRRTPPHKRPATITLAIVSGVWGIFQWKDPTPPPGLDQILVLVFGAWLASEGIDRKNANDNKRKNSDDGADDADDDEETET